MKRIDWLLENEKYSVIELVIHEFCPPAHILGEVGCMKDKGCDKCWNEEMEDE